MIRQFTVTADVPENGVEMRDGSLYVEWAEEEWVCTGSTCVEILL